MIYEFRTYRLKPGSLPEVLRRVEEAYEHRKKYSELVAFWYTEIGPLNQVVHVWPYEDAAERERIRAQAMKDPNWPPPIGEFISQMESEIFVPFPFSPELKPGKHGPFYEMRSYVVRPGGIAESIKRWEGAIEARMKLSPLCAVMSTDVGPLNKYVHLWPYADLNARQEIRKQAVDAGVWPPPGGPTEVLTQESKILLPASFSPMQ